MATKGYDAEHVADIHMISASDAAIWDFAVQNQTVIVTKDDDFAKRKVLANDGPRVIWIRLPNTRRTQLIAWLELMLPSLISALERGETLIELI